jgi:predicted DCC family thiol-disulfide oxidoreductase YuxK
MYEDLKIVIFDGVCNFCNAGVNFLIKRDPKGIFCFAPLQSDISKELIEKFHRPGFDLSTFLFIKDGVCYKRSDAIIEIINELGGYWLIFRILVLIPKPVRDFFYDLIAQNRYKIFGKREHCMVPSKDIRKRFLIS